MTETQQVVIFDTNAYRRFCECSELSQCKIKIKKLLSAEKANNTEAIANPYTIMELVAHLVDMTDPYFCQCLNALVALGIHTQIDNGIKILADTETTICRELFQKIPPDHQKALDEINSLVAHIRENATNLSNQNLQESLKKISARVEAMERWWIDNMKSTITQYDPESAATWELGKGDKSHQKNLRKYFTSENFLQKYAAIHVIYYASRVNIELNETDLTEKTNQYLKAFGTPMRLMLKIYEKIASAGGYTLEHHKENRGNYVWDYMIAFAVGTEHSISKADVFVVTGDKKIKEAAVEAGCGDRVLKLDDYLASIGMSL